VNGTAFCILVGCKRRGRRQRRFVLRDALTPVDAPNKLLYFLLFIATLALRSSRFAHLPPKHPSFVRLRARMRAGAKTNRVLRGVGQTTLCRWWRHSGAPLSLWIAAAAGGVGDARFACEHVAPGDMGILWNFWFGFGGT